MSQLFVYQTRAAVEYPIRGKVEISDLNLGTVTLNSLQQPSTAALPVNDVNGIAEMAYVSLKKALDQCQAVIREMLAQNEYIVDDLYGYMFIDSVATNNIAVYHYLYGDEDVSTERAKALLLKCIQQTKTLSQAAQIFPLSLKIEVFELAEAAIRNLQAILRAQGKPDEAYEFEPLASQAASFADKGRAQLRR